jgi:hypothetical protein
MVLLFFIPLEIVYLFKGYYFLSVNKFGKPFFFNFSPPKYLLLSYLYQKTEQWNKFKKAIIYILSKYINMLFASSKKYNKQISKQKSLQTKKHYYPWMIIDKSKKCPSISMTFMKVDF